MRTRTRSAAAFLLLAVIFAAATTCAQNLFQAQRLDLTERRLYTLSPGTRAGLQKLEEPIRLRFFFSRQAAAPYPALRRAARQVRGLLAEMRAQARGKLIVQIIDPAPFSEAEDRALAYGLQALPVEDGEALFFGLAGSNLVDGLEVIPLFSPAREDALEYDIMRLIQALARPRRPRLGLVTSLPLDTGPAGLPAALEGRARPYLAYQELARDFQIRFLEQDFRRVPPDIALLVIVHPKPLSPSTLYAIDQFVMRGGRILAFLDPNSELSRRAGPGGQILRGSHKRSNLRPLLAAWGVDFDSAHVLGDRQLAKPVAASGRPAAALRDYLLWIDLGREEMPADIITGGLERITLATAGRLRPRPAVLQASGARFQPLLVSSAEAMLFPVERLAENATPDALLAEFTPAGQPYILAARLTGPLASAFPAGPPPDSPAQEKPEDRPEHLARTAERPAHLIVVGDADLFDDRFWAQSWPGQNVIVPFADNGRFILNAVDHLLGSEELISLRARPFAARGFERVARLRARARRESRARERGLQEKIATLEERARARALPGGGRAGGGPSGAPVLSEEERRAAAGAGRELAEARAQLRAVQAELRREIDQLAAWIRFLNIGAMPLLVALLALAAAAVRARRRARPPALAAS